MTSPRCHGVAYPLPRLNDKRRKPPRDIHPPSFGRPLGCAPPSGKPARRPVSIPPLIRAPANSRSKTPPSQHAAGPRPRVPTCTGERSLRSPRAGGLSHVMGWGVCLSASVTLGSKGGGVRMWGIGRGSCARDIGISGFLSIPSPAGEFVEGGVVYGGKWSGVGWFPRSCRGPDVASPRQIGSLGARQGTPRHGGEIRLLAAATCGRTAQIEKTVAFGEFLPLPCLSENAGASGIYVENTRTAGILVDINASLLLIIYNSLFTFVLTN